jgi:cell fate regulator YaaT (PSP1 superfamily)
MVHYHCNLEVAVLSLYEVRFVGGRRGLFLNTNDLPVKEGDPVIVAVERGDDLGTVSRRLEADAYDDPDATYFAIIRMARPEDIERLEQNAKLEQEALTHVRERVAEHNLNMKVVAAEYQWDGQRVTFLFTAERRVDFRELVRELASHFRARIELRQIGVRDEARRIDGYGVCGCRLCCSSWLPGFDPITTQMARDQHLSLNPSKISGCCGRLLCCLAYERDDYIEAHKRLPKIGQSVPTKDGPARVVRVLGFSEELVVRNEEGVDRRIPFDEVRALRKKQTGGWVKGNADNKRGVFQGSVEECERDEA